MLVQPEPFSLHVLVKKVQTYFSTADEGFDWEAGACCGNHFLPFLLCWLNAAGIFMVHSNYFNADQERCQIN